MQQVPTESSEQHHQSINALDNDPNRHHGPCLCPRLYVSPCPVSVDHVGDQLGRLQTNPDCGHAPTPSTGVVRRESLDKLPNEILTQILSHLQPDSHAAVALVSKRFYSLVTSPHAWRMAFFRFYAGHTLIDAGPQERIDPALGLVQPRTRYFGRLTALASWRSEYLVRTRLIRCLMRGKPASRSGFIGSSGRAAGKNSAVLTYDTKLYWPVTSIHAILSNRQKPPRVIHGAARAGVATISDPTTGKVEKWGLEDTFAAAQPHPTALLYGLGDGPATVPNVMDVSQPYGILVGEGFPGGRAHFRGAGDMSGRYLDAGISDVALPGVPSIPQASEAICSVWIAKSSITPATTQSRCGIFTGSTLGIVTAYSLGRWDAAGSRRSDGDMTARWVVSPGVPIIALKVDDDYSQARKSASRMWAVALNALGEVYYLTETPVCTESPFAAEDAAERAWLTGRSVQWRLIQATQRVQRPDEPVCGVARQTFGIATVDRERRPVEMVRYGPAYFRRLYEGWDMQRRLEVDFAADDGNGAGEGVFVIDCGLAADRSARVSRWSRSTMICEVGPEPESSVPCASAEADVDGNRSARVHEWRYSLLELGGHGQAFISASSMDCSTFSLLTLTEDPLHAPRETSTQDGTTASSIPGRRARFIAVGTGSGAIVVWNARQRHADGMQPVRIIQTQSPEIRSLAVSALYLVHGGSDGLVQAWDHLASTTDAIRTIHVRSSGRRHRHAMGPDLTWSESNHAAAGAVYLDPDPTVLRGVVSLGALVRFWSFSASGQPASRKFRHRHSDMHGRLASRRSGGAVSVYIAAEEAEVRREKEQRAREQARLHRRFGALGDLTEEEALRYAQMVSQETFLQDERRRASDSAADASFDTASSLDETAVDTVTPPPAWTATESHLEQQMQQALRLSLLEADSPGGFEYAIRYKAKGNRKGKRRTWASPTARGGPSQAAPSWEEEGEEEEEEALARALGLSLQDQASSSSSSSPSPSSTP
ncbi:hypothetical protein L249_8947 [Ophiocordyceps polyrhachis-furcata BCC 54312]|uniref:F-box domain-containing protein n=1 Tax=Ophiocordyceps polyrhachis-furcata BCC 54312 TaxID=1330021 RepID=A0A367L276_9HYPO|nr:hypothetical protein L249_8947 [Ophiocordyceps polyrhachis-furcata BCC 54312]